MKKKLKDVCTFIGGGTPSKTKEEYWNGGIPWASVKDLQGYYITETIDNISAAGLKNSSANMCEKDDLILATRIAPGRAAIAKIPVAINQDLKIVKSDMSNEWLKYFFKCKESEILQNSGGTTVKGISLDFLGKVEVPIISLDDQIKIAAHLDTIQSAIDNKKQQLALLDEAVKSEFVEMFGENPVESGKWKVEKFGNCGTFKNGMNYSPNENGVNILCLNVSDFKDNHKIQDCETLSSISLSEEPSSEYYLQNDDIVFVRSNGNRKLVGRCVALYPNGHKVLFSGFCIRFRKNFDELNTDFLLQFLKTDLAREQLKGKGANIQNLNQQILSNLQLPVPPLDLQNQFAAFVQQIDKAKSIAKQQLADLQELLDSKMQHYFA